MRNKNVFLFSGSQLSLVCSVLQIIINSNIFSVYALCSTCTFYTVLLRYLLEVMDSKNNIEQCCLKENNNAWLLENKKSLLWMCIVQTVMTLLGFSSHIAAIIYYLSHVGYIAHITSFAEILNKAFNVERVNSVINVDSDENE